MWPSRCFLLARRRCYTNLCLPTLLMGESQLPLNYSLLYPHADIWAFSDHMHPCHAARHYPVNPATFASLEAWKRMDSSPGVSLPPLFAQHRFFTKGEAQKLRLIIFTFAAFIQAPHRKRRGASKCKQSSKRCRPCPPLFPFGSGLNEPLSISV